MDLIPETDKIDMAYLKSEAIGKVISRGLAELYKKQPPFPIEYLGKWLLNYCKTENSRSSMQQHIAIKEALIEQGQKEQLDRQRILHDELVEQQALREIETAFKDKIKKELFHEKLLKHEFCNFLKKRDATGVYVGYVDHPTKAINENDDEESAHLDTDQPKLIKYIGADDSHQFIIGQTLALDQGVTGEVFKEIPPPDDPSLPVPSPVVYIPDVTKNPAIVYFKWKKLGAYLAIPLVYNSCLFPGSLDAGIEERNRFKKAYAEKQAEKENKITEFQNRIKEAVDSEQDATPIQEELDQYLQNWQDEGEAPFTSQKRQFVVCIDTLGQDREISPEDRTYFEDYVNLFARDWQAMEAQLLSEDIDRMIAKLEQGLPKEKAEQLTMQEEQAVDQQVAQFDELKDREKLHQFSVQGLRVNILAQQIASNQGEFLDLKQYRVIKYPGILLGLLLFLGFKKQELVIQGTNQLDWDGVKHYLSEDLIQKIQDYDYKGPRVDDVPKYCKLGRLIKRFSKYQVELVEDYNTCYAKILKWVQLVLKLRQMDIEIRREKIANHRRLIQEKQEEGRKLKEEKETKLEEKKATLSPEELETFSKEEWEAQFDEEHPAPQVPDDIEDDVDNDYDFDEQ